MIPPLKGVESIQLLPMVPGTFPPDLYYLATYGAMDFTHHPHDMSPRTPTVIPKTPINPAIPYNAVSQSINYSGRDGMRGIFI